ncbi:MAG: LysM peptidoglycan-binding domain-containing protein [Candidatus Hydrogenedens sp.]|nr:LysM peptidoglycan-binding domain-containing protein [Candidatus Hydrogenedens sp.]
MSNPNRGLRGLCTFGRARTILLAAPLLLAYGCATSKHAEVHQFDPLPSVQVGARDLQPVSMRPVAELVREAETAYAAANAAQERGDSAEATRQYGIMLDRMVEAGLDPHLFRADSQGFAQVVDGAVGADGRYTQRNFQGRGLETPGKYGSIRIPFPLPERVLIEIEEIQTRYPKNFQIGLDRSQKYAPYIQQELRKAGLPEELVWLCMVESQFNEKIDSRAGAGGMWQFMPPTARRYQLRLDSYVDERYDWEQATQSAVAMLTELYEFFNGDWSLAISAYNMGEGGLSRAIAANGGMNDFWRLIETPPAADTIKRETKKYYPRFLATLIVATNPERYGFRRNAAPMEELAKLPVDGTYSLDALDRALGQPSGTLARLNPHLIQEMTPPGGGYALRVPAAKRDVFASALSQAQTNQTRYASNKSVSGSSGNTGTSTHRVKRGDTVSKIASRYGVSQSDLMRVNHIRSPRELQIGKTLRIPGGSAPAQEEMLAKGGPSTSVDHQPTRTASTYRVKRGDTLYAIAQENRVPLDSLLEWNSLAKSDSLQVGQELKLYPASDAVSSMMASHTAPASSTSSTQTAAYHEVRAGEYPAKIARIYDMSVDEFLRLNGMSKDSTIQVGQKVKVLGNGSASTSTASASAPRESAGTSHKVRSGESATSIASKYGVSANDILAANGLNSRSILRVGQELKIPSTSTASAPNNQVAKATAQTHVVAPGHNPTSIARRYGVKVSDLYEWNQWSRNHVLHIGDEVLILK